ncbi:VOC family protein [Pseudomonas entomophila]|uniref:bleomycin resistance protein n=1 Tax=Pseudomonas entomophila TaxID=312306 RepID=UPI002406C752|nr:VOC family protein [Pseudomonas entomophila]MDF9616405.1 VOC family protein [Pseudomonas entomophila]
MFPRSKLVPELIVTDLQRSLAFWVSDLGFQVAYRRPEEGFAYLDLGGAQIMLEQVNLQDQWITGRLEAPLGRGINFQIDVGEVAPVIERLNRRGWPLFQACEDAWYRAGAVEVGQRQFLVQDPDGYLLRLAERLGERPLPPTALPSDAVTAPA